MGCDIHVHTEVKINGVWHHMGAPTVMRDYNLFSRMADVRNSEPRIDPIAAPRGLPEEISFLTRFDYERMEGDAHSASWISGEEIDALDEWMRERQRVRDPNRHWYIEKEFGYVFGNGWNVKRYPSDYPEGVEETRWVFWFDN